LTEGGRPCQPRYGRGLFYREAFLGSGGGLQTIECTFRSLHTSESASGEFA